MNKILVFYIIQKNVRISVLYQINSLYLFRKLNFSNMKKDKLKNKGNNTNTLCADNFTG